MKLRVGMRTELRVRWLVSGALLFFSIFLTNSASAADDSAPGTVDVEAQLRELESAKRLMKALGEMHAQSAPGGQAPAQGRLAAPADLSAEMAKSAPDATKITSSGDFDVAKMAGVDRKDAAERLSQAARVVTGERSDLQTSMTRPANMGSSTSEAAAPRARGYDNDERVRSMMENLIDEIAPWAISFAAVFGVGYTTLSWFTGRAAKTPKGPVGESTHRSGSRRRRGSRARSTERRRNRE